MIRRAYVEGRWGQVHLRESGAGPMVVLLHQSPLSGLQFEPALPHLAAAGFRAVALDTAGYGASAHPPAPPSIADHADALLGVLDALGAPRVHLLGYHTGAAIACNFAVRHPTRIDRLVLNGVPLLSPDERAHFAQFRFTPLTLDPDGAHLMGAWRQRLAASPGWTDLAAMHRHVLAMLANPEHYGWGFEAAFAYDIAADLAALVVPTLILTNTGEDLYAASRRAAALRPDLAYAELAGGTHDIVDEQPEAWAAAVAAFLKGPTHRD